MDADAQEKMAEEDGTELRDFSNDSSDELARLLGAVSDS
jgi:hypothetical protein